MRLANPWKAPSVALAQADRSYGEYLQKRKEKDCVTPSEPDSNRLARTPQGAWLARDGEGNGHDYNSGVLWTAGYDWFR